MKAILERAARTGNAQMRVQSFSDRRPDRVVWPDRQWEWAALRFENGQFDSPASVDTEAREKWFYQAIGASPAMFRRDSQAGSLYWLGHRDATGAYLDGGRAYKLTVPLPVPGKLFWSVTVYDARTRSQIQTAQARPCSAPYSTSPTLPGTTQLTCSSGPPPRPATRTSGSRPTPEQAGSSTSASTAPSRRLSTRPGNPETSSPGPSGSDPGMAR
jgi:hypothetical protein